MTPERVRASRAAEMRRAARSWEQAHLIDRPTRVAIEDAYPSDGDQHARAWRVVIFVIASVAIIAAFGAYAMVEDHPGAAAFLFFGAIVVAATEALDRSNLRGNGAVGATSFWAVVAVSVGFGLLADSRGGASDEIDIGLLIAAVAFALACWRWGIEIYGAFAAAAFFLLLAQFPGARALWIAVGLLLLAGTVRLFDRAALSPEHRAAMTGVFGTSALALYAAVNRFSVDRRLVEFLSASRGAMTEPSAAARTAAVIATTLLPLVFLAWGIRSRRRLILDLGALFTALSLVTLRYYVHIAPLWVILCAAGAALLLAALGLNRKLRRSPQGEWGGFTAHSLYSGKAGSLAAAVAVAGFAPDARLPDTPDSSGFTGGGGRSGGGGAAGSF